MDSIFQKNMESLRINFPDMYQLYREYKEIDNYNVVVDNGNVAIEYNDRLWLLNSLYDSKVAAKIWTEQFEIKNNRVFVMLGLGNADYAIELKKRCGEKATVIVYEPNSTLFSKLMENTDMTYLFEEGVGIAVDGINESHIFEYLQSVIGYMNRGNVFFCVGPNYEMIYPEKNKWLRSLVVNQIAAREIDKNTELEISMEKFDNYIENLPNLVFNSSLPCLIKKFSKVNKTVPAVVVAAGPSLSKNINELKAFKNKALIIACDSAINPLLKSGIVPDIAVTLDSHKPLDLFEREEVKDMPLVMDLQAVPWLNENHKGKKIYIPDNSLSVSIMKKYGVDIVHLETCGSVANDAFSLAQMLGFTTIIIIGQDLSYAIDGQYYANGVHENNRVDSFNNKEDKIEIDGYYGGKVYTVSNLYMYKTWFEKQIIRYPELHVINSTEGGALIVGAENLPLKEALNRECSDIEQDFRKVIDSVEPTFSIEEQKEIIQYFKSADELLKNCIKKINGGIDAYRKMQSLIAQGKTGNSEFRRMLEKTNEVQKMVENESILLFAALHNRETEYSVLDEEFDDDNEIVAAKQSIKAGIRMLESYLYGIDRTLEVLPKLRENFDKISALYS